MDPISCKLFADDVKLYSKISTQFDAIQLSNALQELVDWSSKWQLKINEVKSSILNLGSIKTGVCYSISGSELPVVNIVRDLGIQVDSSLKFSYHTSQITNAAFRRLGVLLKSFTCRDLSFMRLAFVTYIRPMLEYCTPVWSPYLLTDIDSIESVQRCFSRRIDSIRHLTYCKRLAILDLESLEQRRIKYDLVMYFKILRGFVDMTAADFFKLVDHQYPTRGHPFRIVKPRGISRSLENSFNSRCIDCWNSLPTDFVNASSVAVFKYKLKSFNFGPFLRGRAIRGPQ